MAPHVREGGMRRDPIQSGAQDVEPSEGAGDDGGDPQRRAGHGDSEAAEGDQHEGCDQHRDRSVHGHLRPDAGDQHGERRHQGRGDERPGEGQQQHRQGHRADDRAGGRDEGGITDVAEPPGVAGTDDVERHQPEAHHGEGLAGHPQTAAGEEVGAAEGARSENEQDEGAAADTEPAPRHGQERHRGHEETERSERQQDPRDRGSGQPRAFDVLTPCRTGIGPARGGVRRRARQQRTGRGRDADGGRSRQRSCRLLPQAREKQVGPLQRREELHRAGAGQRQGTAGAGLRCLRKGGTAVGAAGRIGVRRHES